VTDLLSRRRGNLARQLLPERLGRLLVLAIPICALLLPPLFFPDAIEIWVDPFLIAVAGAVGLNLLTGTTGQVSLGQAGFFAVGAYTGVAVGITGDMPFPVAVAASIVSGALVGAIMGLSSSRLRGLYAVMSTLALQYIVVYFGTLYEQHANNTAAFVLPTAKIGGYSLLSTDSWYVVFAVLATGYVFLYRGILRSHIGRALEVIGDRDHIAPMLGIDVFRLELYAWIVSGASVSLVGCLQAYWLGAVSPDFFTLTISIQYFAMIVVGGRGSPLGCVIGAFLLVTVPFELQNVIGSGSSPANLGDYDNIAYGVLLIICLAVAPDGIAGRLRRVTEMASRRVGGTSLEMVLKSVASRTPKGGRTGSRAPDHAEPLSSLQPMGVQTGASAGVSERDGESQPKSAPTRRGALEVDSLDVAYRSGATAIHDVSISVGLSEMVAILGRNGAGKTTLLRAIAGFVIGEPGLIRSGSIVAFGTDITHKRPYRRAKDGVVLVPEREKVFQTLTVEENLELAVTRRRSGKALKGNVLDLFPAIGPKLKVRAGLLSGGERQMLAIARALMLEPRMLLLDETTLGLAPIVARQVLSDIARVVHSTGVSVLLVEQNAVLASLVAERYYVLQSGCVVEHGAFDGNDAGERLASMYLGN
jgi:branched-chain amino acid transport system permease protein